MVFNEGNHNVCGGSNLIKKSPNEILFIEKWRCHIQDAEEQSFIKHLNIK